MSKKLTASEYAEFCRKIENASSISELRAIERRIMEYSDEDPQVKELVRKLTR